MKKILSQYGIDKKNQKNFENVFSGKEFNANSSEISAEVIEILLTEELFKNKITDKGLIVKNAIITGVLNLEFLKVEFPIIFNSTTFNDTINLKFSKIESLFMEQCKLEKGIKLMGAKIDGQLNFKGSSVKSIEKAINARNAIVNGHVRLCNDDNDNIFFVKGQVDLEDITIKGSFDCSNANFNAPEPSKENNYKPRALTFSSAKITGNVWMNKKFKANGEVRFIGANIGGDLNCRGGQFFNSTGRAIDADLIKVNGNVYLEGRKIDEQKFSALGQVNLSGAKIAGQLSFFNAEIANPDENRMEKRDDPETALRAKGIKINGPLFIENIQVKGSIDLTDAIIKGRFELIDIKSKSSPCQIILKSAYAREYKDNMRTCCKNVFFDTKHFTYDIFSEINNKEANENRKEFKKTIKKRIDCCFFPLGKKFAYQPYLQMAKVIEEAGYSNEAVWLRMKMNDKKRKSNIKISQKVWLWILKVLIGYGYKPIRVIYWAIGIWLLGALFFSYGNDKGQIKPPSKFAWEKTNSTNEEKDYKYKDNDIYVYYTEFDPIIYSLDVFLPIVNLGQQDFWKPVSKYVFTYKWFKFSWSWLLCYMYIEILLGWFLTSMLIAGISGLIKQK